MSQFDTVSEKFYKKFQSLDKNKKYQVIKHLTRNSAIEDLTKEDIPELIALMWEDELMDIINNLS